MPKTTKIKETEAPSAARDGIPEPPAPTAEEIAKAAYARVAEELKDKGDFPEWYSVSAYGQALYVEGAAHVLAGGAPRTRFEEVVSFMSAFPDGVRGVSDADAV